MEQTPEDIYKSHLAESGGVSRRRDGGGQQVDSARANLASTFVNAFVNAGYGQDQARGCIDRSGGGSSDGGINGWFVDFQRWRRSWLIFYFQCLSFCKFFTVFQQ